MIHSEIEIKDRGASTPVKIFVSSKVNYKTKFILFIQSSAKTQGVKTSFHRT